MLVVWVQFSMGICKSKKQLKQKVIFLQDLFLKGIVSRASVSIETIGA
jgi:hypothetical protein